MRKRWGVAVSVGKVEHMSRMSRACFILKACGSSRSNKPYILSILSYMHIIYENIHKRVFCYSGYTIHVTNTIGFCHRVSQIPAVLEYTIRKLLRRSSRRRGGGGRALEMRDFGRARPRVRVRIIA